MHKQSPAERLAEVPLFSSCSTRDLRELARHIERIDIPAGKVIVEQGTRGRQFLVLEHGTAAVHIDDELVRELEDGDFFGELALLADRPRTATVTSTSDCELLVLDAQAFHAALRDTPQLAVPILEQVAQRLLDGGAEA